MAKIRTNADARAEIARAGLSMRQIAPYVGIHYSALSRMTSDLRGRPSPEFIAVIEQAIADAVAERQVPA